MRWLLDTETFMPRACCGQWEQWELWLYATGNSCLFIGYAIVLPVVLFLLWTRWSSLGPLAHLALWFGAFIFFCGLYHGLDLLSIWAAPYRLTTLVGMLASGATWGTIREIWRHRKFLSEYPTPAQWREKLESERRKAEDLAARCNQLEAEIDALRGHGIESEERFSRISLILERLRRM